VLFRLENRVGGGPSAVSCLKRRRHVPKRWCNTMHFSKSSLSAATPVDFSIEHPGRFTISDHGQDRPAIFEIACQWKRLSQALRHECED
jgi:hypothetical protein